MTGIVKTQIKFYFVKFDWNIFSQCFSGSHKKLSLVLLQLTNYILWPFKSVKRMQNALNYFSIITLMIIENWALWLARSFASSRFNHRAVIITLTASSFQHGSQICWCFRVGNWLILEENAAPQKTKDAANLESSYQGRLIKFLFCK